MSIPNEMMKALRELCQNATPGPWYWVSDTLVSESQPPFVIKPCNTGMAFKDEVGIYAKAQDREFISTSRNVIPALLDEIELLYDQLAVVKRRMLAAIFDMTAKDICTICLHGNNKTQCADHRHLSSAMKTDCFHWRDICAENSPDFTRGNVGQGSAPSQKVKPDDGRARCML